MDLRRPSGVWRLTAVSAVIVLLAVACTGAGDDGEDSPVDGEIEEITWALPGFPDVLFPPHAWSTYTGAIMSLVQEGLLAFGDDLSLKEGVAESWEQTDDVTYVYRIRDGVTFHDGSPVTAEDVAYSMSWHLEPDSRSQLTPFYGSVDSITATGPNEVTVTLSQPDAQFQYTVAHMSGFIFKKEQLEANPEDIGTPAVLPLGTGPYRLVEFSPDTQVVLERYDDYWGPTPPVQRIVMKPITDQQTRLLAMRNGDIDGTFDLPIEELDQWEGLDNVDVVTTPSNGVYLLTLDHETPPFDDIHVRRAIAHAVDKAGLVQGVLNGKGEPALALNPPGMWAGVLEESEVRAFYDSLPQYEFDLDQARAELAQSSVPDGFRFNVQAPASYRAMVNAVLNLSENLQQIGVTVDVQEVDDGQWLDVYFAHENLGVQTMTYFPDYADPANYPFLFLHSSNASQDAMNASNYRNPMVDAALDDALQESDPAVRAEALQRAIQVSSEEVAVVPIFWPDSAMAIRSDYRLDGYNSFWYNVPWAIRGFGTR